MIRVREVIMQEIIFSVFPSENFVDLGLYQYGWEQCAPLHSFGPFIRNHYLFHYIISGKGMLFSHAVNGDVHEYELGAGQGFLICPGQVTTYAACEDDPWKYVWLEFDGLRAKECIMDTVSCIQENAEDIYAEACQINEERANLETEFEDESEAYKEVTEEGREI